MVNVLSNTMRMFCPEENSAQRFLRNLKMTQEKYLGSKVAGLLLLFQHTLMIPKRQATINTGKIAGLDVKRIVNEPTAAALAYGLANKKDEK